MTDAASTVPTHPSLSRLGEEALPMHYRPVLGDLGSGLEGVNVFDGTLASPLALLREEAVRHNIAAMQKWCSEHGVELAPHGKTTMAPALFSLQLQAGSWGLTVASPAQARVALAAGARRVLIANQVTDAAGIRWLGQVRRDDPGVALWCYVDSAEGVDLLEQGLAQVLSGSTRLDVLLEIGIPGGRTGARTDEQALEVARAVAVSSHLRLAGVAGYEGVAAGQGGDVGLAAVDAFCRRLGAFAARLHTENLIHPTDEHPLILSAGGSAYFDHVAAVLTAAEATLQPTPALVVLRSGAYVTHDHGLYSRTTPTARCGDGPELTPAFEVWGRVLSRPEPGRAIVDVGRRDAPFDQDLPLPLWCRAASGGAARPLAARVVSLNDQHAFLDLPVEESLAVGQWVGFGISHPCTAADKWNLLLMVDDHDHVVAQMPTFF
jgi:D-serine deaminase-like pyridoxal phosphate-dependent protein